jgi:hypothetical protein
MLRPASLTIATRLSSINFWLGRTCRNESSITVWLLAQRRSPGFPKPERHSAPRLRTRSFDLLHG